MIKTYEAEHHIFINLFQILISSPLNQVELKTNAESDFFENNNTFFFQNDVIS